MIKKLLCLLLSGLFIFSGIAYAQEVVAEDFTGMINADNVNVRSGASTNFEIIRKMNHEELVLVVGTYLDWYKIKLPRNSKAYVTNEFIRMNSPVYGYVTANRVNVRAGKGTNFNVIGQLNENDVIELVEKDGEWSQIYSDSNCYAWVHKDFVNNHGPSDIYTSLENKGHEAWKLLHQARIFEQTNSNFSSDDEKKAASIQKYNAIIRDYPDTQAADAAKKQIARLSAIAEPAQAAVQKQTVEANPVKQEAKPVKGIKAEKTEPAAPKKQRLLTKPATQPLAEGKLVEAGRFFSRPGTHKLLQKKKTKYFLTSETIDLNNYIYHTVQIWGSIVSSEKAKTPTIDVEYVHQLN